MSALLKKWPWLWLVLWFLPALFYWNTNLEHALSLQLTPPSLLHPFGFDTFGRDLLPMVLNASIHSVAFGLGAVAYSCLISLFFGVFLALAPRLIRFIGLRALEFLLAFPSLLLALCWAAIRGPGWDTLMVSLTLGTFPGFTRLLEVRTRELLSEDYIQAAWALGGSSFWIAWRHLIPALLSVCAIKLPGLFAHVILAEATLSFLGIGAPLGSNTWGALLAQGKDYLIEAPHITFAAGLPLLITVLALQLLSEKKTQKHLRI